MADTSQKYFTVARCEGVACQPRIGSISGTGSLGRSCRREAYHQTIAPIPIATVKTPSNSIAFFRFTGRPDGEPPGCLRESGVVDRWTFFFIPTLQDKDLLRAIFGSFNGEQTDQTGRSVERRCRRVAAGSTRVAMTFALFQLPRSDLAAIFVFSGRSQFGPQPHE